MSSVAVVARTGFNGLEYLAEYGDRVKWAVSEAEAAHFENVREATRAAMRLPSSLRAYALPSLVAA
jgi:hypothetical protein